MKSQNVLSQPLFDVHSHLQDEAFSKDLSNVIADIEKSKLSGVINAGTDLDTSRAGIKLAEENPKFWAMAGFHPHDAKKWQDDSLKELKKLLDHPKVLGIGEIGLDYHYDFSPRDVQKSVFSQQWILAAEMNLPIEVHIREAFDDFWKIIKELPKPSKVLLHCFSGGIEEAKKALDLDFSFSIGGVITFPKSLVTVEVFKMLPIERIQLETDSPYLSPIPFRGRRNNPTLIFHTFEKVCEIKSLDFSSAAQKFLLNINSFFGSKITNGNSID
ncbi:MAG: TatD family hydrolase [Candidatus Riflebacteria bacterium]|nr:TatD family hydrolase [Candidatus Riflebacteria bacterium]